MITDADVVLGARFAGTFDHTDDSDWAAVAVSAQRVRRHRAVVFALATAVVVVGAASALVFSHPTINFLSASKGPRTVVDDFGSMQVGAPPGMAPGVLPQGASEDLCTRFSCVV
jgi:hypothetical protein